MHVPALHHPVHGMCLGMGYRPGRSSGHTLLESTIKIINQRGPTSNKGPSVSTVKVRLVSQLCLQIGEASVREARLEINLRTAHTQIAELEDSRDAVLKEMLNLSPNPNPDSATLSLITTLTIALTLISTTAIRNYPNSN